jgi:hypothetical protein
MASVSEQLDEQIRIHGSARDALNVALTQLSELRYKLNCLKDTYIFYNCPRCSGIYNQNCVCINCGYDSTIFEE